jgi:hypothetical protein
MADRPRDVWDKLAIIFQSLGGFVTAAVVAVLGIVGSSYLSQKQALDTNVRLYTELMSKREESESALRKDMFASIIDTFLKPQVQSLDTRVLNLELLAYNFHESLNLKPLFVNIEQQIKDTKDPKKQDFRNRLSRVAREITRKQMVVLEAAGQKVDTKFPLADVPTYPGGAPLELEETVLTLDGVKREFRFFVMELDPVGEALRLRMEVVPQEPPFLINNATFWVGFYDFPMIDHTRLSHDQRVAVTLNSLDEGYANLTVVYFPGSFASLKEKPYYQEVVKDLLKNSETKAGTQPTAH